VNIFNALNGKEAKQAILNEVSRALDNDSEFREHLTFPRVSWNWRLEMNIYPRTPSEKIVEVVGEAVQMKTVPDPLDSSKVVMARDAAGNYMPVVEASETHVKEVLHATREIQAPDAIREVEGLQQNQAGPGGIRMARSVEVGKAARNPVLSPGLNRG
jgi:hypothetical protein